MPGGKGRRDKKMKGGRRGVMREKEKRRGANRGKGEEG